MSLVITYSALILYLFLVWREVKKRKVAQEKDQEADLKPLMKKSQVRKKSVGVVRKPKVKGHSSHKLTTPRTFDFKANLDRYRRANNIGRRDFSSRIESRKALVDQNPVSAQLPQDARIDAYRLDKIEEKALGWKILQKAGSKKNLILIREILQRPRAYLPPAHIPGYWWK